MREELARRLDDGSVASIDETRHKPIAEGIVLAITNPPAHDSRDSRAQWQRSPRHIRARGRAGQGRELAPARADRGRVPAAARRAARGERGRPAHVRRPDAAGLRARDRRRDPPLDRRRAVGTRPQPAVAYPAGVKVEATFHGDRKVFSVSAFNQGIGIYLRRLPALWVEGEVTELRRNEAWAFVFFTLKDPDSGACVRATMQRRRFDAARPRARATASACSSRARPRSTRRRASSASARRTIERIGLGDHLAAIERLKRVLAAEGLFAAERKRPLPRFPRAVGVVTGADAAARGDVVAGSRRGSRPRTSSSPRRACRAHGAGAGSRRRSARRRAPCGRRRDRRRAAAAASRISSRSATRPSCARSPRCPVPVVSAVGHEQDTPLCDLAADVRASTPTAAARLVVPDLGELNAGLARLRDQLDGSVRRALARDRERLERDRLRLRAAPRPPARAAARRARPRRRPAAGALAARHPRARLRRRPLRRLGAEGRRDGRPGQPPRDRARDRRASRATVDGGAAVSDGEDGRADVRGAPPRARGDRRQARARRRRGRRGDRALAAGRGAPPALRRAARGRRGQDRGALRAVQMTRTRRRCKVTRHVATLSRSHPGRAALRRPRRQDRRAARRRVHRAPLRRRRRDRDRRASTASTSSSSRAARQRSRSTASTSARSARAPRSARSRSSTSRRGRRP